MTRCPVCRGLGISKSSPYLYKSQVFQPCFLVECANCGMIFASPMPNESLLSDYNSRNLTNAHEGESTERSTKAFFSAMAQLRVT